MSKRLSKMGWIVLVTLLSLALVILPACTAAPAEEEEEEQATAIPYNNDGIFVQDTIGDIDSMDPAYAYDTASSEQIQNCYDTLLWYKGTSIGEFVPLLASELPTVVNDTQIKFKIRSGVTFHSGNPLTPADVEYSIQRALVQDRDAGPIWMLYNALFGLDGSRDADGKLQVTFDQIDNAVQVDGDWVVFNFVKPYPMVIFQQMLCHSCTSIVDKKWCVQNGDWDGTAATWQTWNNAAKSKSPLYNKEAGSGPWKLDKWDPGVSVTLSKNANYFRGNVPFNSVVTYVRDEWTARKLDLLNGNADLVYVDPSNIGEMLAEPLSKDLNKYSGLPNLTCDAFFFNFAIAPTSKYIGSGKLDGNGIPTDFFTDKDVRQGFSYAFDWNTYINVVMNGEAKQAVSPIVDGLFGYNPNASHYSYNLTLAADHLKAAWGGQVWANGFKFTVVYNIGNTARKTCCEMLSEKLASVNPKFVVDIQPLSWPVYLDEISRTPYLNLPLFRMGWLADFPDPDNFVTPFMHSTGTFSGYTHYSNPTVDALIVQARYLPNGDQRKNIYYQLQELYYNDPPGIMLVQNLGRRWFTKYIHGFYFNPMYSGLPGPLYEMSKSQS
jgi:peptide/nickel transport system substrate-binding protein